MNNHFGAPEKFDLIVGIDNGLSGAIAVLHVAANTVSVANTPVVPGTPRFSFMPKKDRTRKGREKLEKAAKARRGNARVYDQQRMNHIFFGLRQKVGPSAQIAVVIEEPGVVRIGQRQLTTMATLRSLQDGQTRWQVAAEPTGAFFFEVVPSTWKSDMKISSDKETSMALIKKLYPKIAVKSHDQAEAVLIAHWFKNFYTPDIVMY